MNQGRNILSIGLICTFVAILAVGEPAWAQTSEPILSVEVGTHSAGIMRIAMDPSNRILVTGSEDKTVRVWDISGRGELLAHPAPPCGCGQCGEDSQRCPFSGRGDRGLWRLYRLAAGRRCMGVPFRQDNRRHDPPTGRIARNRPSPFIYERRTFSRGRDGKGRHTPVPSAGLHPGRGGHQLRRYCSMG